MSGTFSVSGGVVSPLLVLIIFKVYLDREELKTLNVGEQITVVGILDSIEKQGDLTAIFTMKTARFVTNISKISGVIGEKSSFNGLLIVIWI